LNTVKTLVKESQNKNRDAFARLVEIYQDKVYGLSFQLTGNHSDAQDLAQDVFIRAYTNLDGFRNNADFGTWLHRIAVNHWINSRQKEKRLVTVSLDEPVRAGEEEMTRELAATGADPLEAVAGDESQDLVRSALRGLSREHRAVLVLREIEGYNYEDMAAVLNCSVGTVKSRLNRARQLLRQKVVALAGERGTRIPGRD